MLKNTNNKLYLYTKNCREKKKLPFPVIVYKRKGKKKKKDKTFKGDIVVFYGNTYISALIYYRYMHIGVQIIKKEISCTAKRLAMVSYML